MKVEKNKENKFGSEWEQKQLEIELGKIHARKPMTQQVDESTSRLQQILQKIRSEHPEPQTTKPKEQLRITRSMSNAEKKRVREKLRTEKEQFPQTRDLADSASHRGVHDTMNRRFYKPMPTVPDRLDELVEEEVSDQERLNPSRKKKKGWGPFNQEKRGDFAEDVFVTWSINSALDAAKWVDQHLNSKNPKIIAHIKYLEKHVLSK